MSKKTAESSNKSALRQIAEQAKVSVSTASIVLNGRGDEMRISKATQQRVQEAAHQAGYTPNVYARKLRKSANGNATKVVGVFWSDHFLNESMGEFFYAAYRTIVDNGYHIDFLIRFFTPGKLNDVKDQLNPWQFNGLIFCGSTEEDAKFIESLHLDIPVVLSNNAHSDLLNSVAVDNIDIGRHCAQELLHRGYTKIGIIGKDQLSPGASARFFGFIDEIRRNGIEPCDEWNILINFSDFTSINREIEKILSTDNHPSAFYVASYDGALSIVIAVKNWLQNHTNHKVALLISGYDRKLNVLASNIGFVDLEIGKYAVNSVKVVWMLMHGQLEAPVKWIISPKYMTEELVNYDN